MSENKDRAIPFGSGLSPTVEPASSLDGSATSIPIAEELLAALRPFTDLRHQRGAWGVITRAIGGLAPLTVTVTKAQMQAALAAIARAETHGAMDTAEKLARRMGGTFVQRCTMCGTQAPKAFADQCNRPDCPERIGVRI